jgi:cytochrome c556
MRLVTCIAVALLLPSCKSNPAAPARPATGAAASQKHSVQGQDLKALMTRVSQLNARLPKGLPEDVESPTGRELAVAAASAATSADYLADAALRIPQSLQGKSLSEADRRGFTAQAQTLHDQAVRLRADAEHLKVERMQDGIEQITGTCMACHGRYRDLAGELDLSKSLLPQTAPSRVPPR